MLGTSPGPRSPKTESLYPDASQWWNKNQEIDCRAGSRQAGPFGWRYVRSAPIELPKLVQLHGLGVPVEEDCVARPRQSGSAWPITRHRAGPLGMAGNIHYA